VARMRWERGAVQPSFETLRRLVRACGFVLNVSISRADVDEAGERVCDGSSAYRRRSASRQLRRLIELEQELGLGIDL